jgi:hypothetical protein
MTKKKRRNRTVVFFVWCAASFGPPDGDPMHVTREHRVRKWRARARNRFPVNLYYLIIFPTLIFRNYPFIIGSNYPPLPLVSHTLLFEILQHCHRISPINVPRLPSQPGGLKGAKRSRSSVSPHSKVLKPAFHLSRRMWSFFSHLLVF